MRITYEITATVSEELIGKYEGYMADRHVPDLLATGCFDSASLSSSSPGRYRIRYEAPNRESLDRYLANDAERLRTDFAEHFPDDVSVEREVWEVRSEFKL